VSMFHAVPTWAGDVLKVGDSLPGLQGEFLSGREAALPDSARGRVALLAVGFTRSSQYAVEAWSNRFRKDFGADSAVTFYEIPVIGGLGRLARPFINSGMRRGTPEALHENVITVYGHSGEWKERLEYSDGLFAYLVLLDSSGRVAWRHAGLFDEAQYARLAETTLELRRKP
jgi:hypothetical protein